ncbi:MAG: sialate O-acetylesterase [Bacteroides sp.]|nr:sialate O-acetylesterase [Bacteroides sp.]
MKGKHTLITALLFFILLPAHARLEMPAVFCDNMILQQQSQVFLWGQSQSKEQIVVSPSWSNNKYYGQADHQGWWKVSIETPSAGGPYELTVIIKDTLRFSNVLIGEVWLCAGQSNMHFPVKGYINQPNLEATQTLVKSRNSRIRLFNVGQHASPFPAEDCQGEWVEATPESVAGFSALGYHFGKYLQEHLDVPVGLINCSWGGARIECFMSGEILSTFAEVPYREQGDTITSPTRAPSGIYNGMIHPLRGYAIKGALWYQGEANHNEPDRYKELLPALVKSWREEWQHPFAFYFAQLAPFNYLREHGPRGYPVALLMEVQNQCASLIPDSEIVILMDAGDESCIHPANKKLAGEWFAIQALAGEYGLTGGTYKSPVLRSWHRKENRIVLEFDHAPNGFTSFGKKITGFEVAGTDSVFYPARITLPNYQQKVEVEAPEVAEPIAVRYAFNGYAEATLFNTEGFPLSCFRTDNWPIEKYKNKEQP